MSPQNNLSLNLLINICGHDPFKKIIKLRMCDGASVFLFNSKLSPEAEGP